MLCPRPWEGRVVERLLEDVDFGSVDDAELGQQVYQVRQHVFRYQHLPCPLIASCMNCTELC